MKRPARHRPFVGANPDRQVVIFATHATEALNSKALEAISRGDFDRSRYRIDPATGTYDARLLVRQSRQMATSSRMTKRRRSPGPLAHVGTSSPSLTGQASSIALGVSVIPFIFKMASFRSGAAHGYQRSPQRPTPLLVPASHAAPTPATCEMSRLAGCRSQTGHLTVALEADIGTSFSQRSPHQPQRYS